ncbi:AAA family ATPase [Bradyrhizobium sp. CCGUVB1N3]|uniref:adenylate/guanylate cyclase domain-containing protein n=1 Tax=Bradyrhizobium sp. CCGUVB1N3 TaxID=2949629 RepID=UPI0020B188E3|nr:adenylate/guanylate cyclase domain-containing protein [Bradyrhizobium sp. CCGUVB1N3]MCP3471391.1 AAA family ATPase [Bradyrhizobium sp. CCGUVB1N3]
MQQIADWLEKLGMSEYAQRFAENRVDFSVLRELTDQDLKDIGVVLGDRRKMLRAIADIDGIKKNAPAARAKMMAAPRCTPVASEPIPTATPLPSAAAAEVRGERRYVTVMFCDLVGSTSICAQLDAEEWRDLVCAYLDAACAAAIEMGGHIARKLGDGLMVLFGYPVAQENDAERAARAALSIQRGLAEVNRKNTAAGKPALNARIGIETGAVVVDAAGEIYGDAPNIAARVQALAEPGTVVMTARVQHQVAGLFVVEERGSHELKGVREPVTLYRLVRASGGGRRGGQRHLTPLVGREEEIATLMRRWERARQGDGQLVMIVGEPGLGKSRLIEEFHLRLREVPHTWTEWSCSQLSQNTPLHPIADWGRQRFGGADIPAEQRLADLENTLELVKLDPVENAPLLAPLLDIPMPQTRACTLEPGVLRRRQLTALTNWAMAGARTQPLVLAFEDVHWADPTTLELLRGIAERGALAPLFILITARPEFRPPWGTRSHHSTISLAPLDRSQVRHMVGQLAAYHALPKEVLDRVTERSGGVPLFIEEVTRLLLERGEHGDIHAIPPTLQQSLTARLDRLGAAREVAQIGAVIGRDFSYRLLRAVAGTENVPLQTALERLVEADILRVQGLPPDSEYRFKHVLIVDAAYENLLKSRRQVLHRRVAEALRDNFATTCAAAPELLAHHFTQAGLTEAALEWWGKAGERSLQKSALVEAIEQLTRALDQIASLPSTPALRREQIKLQVALITPLIHVRGYAAPETRAAAEQAHTLIQQAEMLGEHPEDPLLLFSVLYSFWVHHYANFNGKAMRELARQFLTLADKSPSTVPLLIGSRLTGVSLMTTGDIAGSLPHYDRALALYDPAVHHSLATHFSIDAAVAALCFRSWSLWLLGYPDAALASVEDSLKNAREFGQAATLMWALFYAILPHIWCGKYAVAKMQADELVVLANEKGTSFWKANGIRAQGYLLAEVGGAVDAVSMIRSSLDAWRSTGSTLRVPTDLSYLASAYLKVGQFDNAERCIHEAMMAVESTDERWYEAEVNRVAGEVAVNSPDSDAAKSERYFERALAVAREQQARSWELRAAMSLARLWRSQGEPRQARELLAPVYGWFTEGFDTRDLKEAQALLAELAT